MTSRSANDSARRTRRWLIISSGILGSLLLLVIVANIDLQSPNDEPPSRFGDLKDIVVPGQLTAAESARTGSGASPAGLTMREGAWIQAADENGLLAQEYMAERLDPLPDQWLQMSRPVARFYLSNDRLLVMTSDEARARVPRTGTKANALESGHMNGNVIIRMYQPRTDYDENADDDRPALTVTADEADFDNRLGRVVCDRAIHLSSPQRDDAPYAIDFSGEGLTIFLNGQDNSVEELTVERPTSPLYITPNHSAHRKPAPAKSTVEPEAPAAVASNQPAPTSPAPPTSTRAEPRPAPASAITPSTTQATPSTSPAEPPPDNAWYRLVMNDDVRIERIRGDAVSTINGNKLDVVFSMKGEGLSANVSASPRIQVVPAMPLPAAVALSSLAVDPVVAPEEQILVHYSGKLTMTPIRDSKIVPTSTDDVVLTVFGDPVVIRDEPSDTTMKCSQLVVRDEHTTLPSGAIASDTVADLIGRPDDPVTIQHPSFTAEGEQLWIGLDSGRGAFVGKGQMRFLARHHESRALTSIALVCADPLVSSAIIAHALNQSPPAAPPALKTDLEINWTEGVDLEFDKTDAGGDDRRIRAASFNGNVNVVASSFTLESHRLNVGFEPGQKKLNSDKADDAINLIDAIGDVRVVSGVEKDRMNAQRITVKLKQLDGRSIPTSMNAAGAVEALNKDYTLWTEALNVTFVPSLAKPEASPDSNAAPFGNQLGDVDIETMHADREVQVRLGQGARIFAQSMSGDNIAKTIIFESPDGSAMLLHDNIVIDNARALKFDDLKKKASIPGPGTFRQFSRTLVPETDGRIDRPSIPDQPAPAVSANWTDRLEYDTAFNDGGGELDLHGHVSARSVGTDNLTLDTADADRLTFQFRRVEPAATSSATPAQPAPASSQPSFAGLQDGDRLLETFIARGNANIENKVWSDASHSSLVRLFRVAGQHVEFNNITHYSQVIGDGTLTIRDETPSARSTQDAGPFGFKGDTVFHWNRKMECVPQPDGAFRVTMDEKVELGHQGLKDDDWLKFGGDSLVAEFEPQQSDPNAPSTPPQSKDPTKVASIDLGGDLSLRRLVATGRVRIETPDETVDCHQVDYNRQTNIAILTALPGRLVSVLKTGSVSPFRAEKATWDLQNRRIIINKPSGEDAR